MSSNFTAGYSVKQTADGNYVICGSRFNYGGFIAKLNIYGDTLWVKYYPVSEMYSIIESDDGNYVAIGIATPLFIVKVDPSGNTIWARFIPEAGYDIYPYHINKTNDNCFVVAGKAETGNPSTGSGYFIKIDNNGSKVWSKIFGPENGRKAFVHVKQLADNNYILTGGIKPVNTTQIYLVKTDPFGDSIWTNSYGDTLIYEEGKSVFQTSDKGFLIISQTLFAQPEKLLFYRTDGSGTLIWSKEYGNPNSHYGLLYGDGAVKIEYNNTYILAGYKLNYPIIDTLKVFLLNIDSLGNKILERTFFSDTLEARGWSVDACVDSGFVISGQAYPRVSIDKAGSPSLLYIIKTNKSGEINPIGINTNTSQIPGTYDILQNFPNPFNPVTMIKYDIPADNIVNLKVYDLLGREVFSSTEYKTAGSYEVRFDGTNLASGLYFYSINAGNYRDTKKMVLLK